MATLGQNARELKKLYEASMTQGALVELPDGTKQHIPPCREAFRLNMESLIGVETLMTPRGKTYKKLNRAKIKIPVRELDIQALGMEMNGRNWDTHFEQTCGDIHSVTRFEAIAPPQMAASLPITCAINDAYGIFLDGRVYEEEADASYIGDEMCTVQEPIVAGNGAVVNGGFEAGRRTAVPSNDTSGIDVGEAVLPPGMGQMQETMVHRNRARLNARQYSWTYDSVMFNRIADDVTSALDATRIVKFEEERKVADACLGVGTSLSSSANANIGDPGLAMPVQIGGLEFYPYQNGTWATGGGTVGSTTNAGVATPSPLNGHYEQNFANAYDANGAGITQQVLAQILAQRIANRDAFTQDVIPNDLKGDTLFVANDAAEIQVLTLMFQWFIGQWGTVLGGVPASPVTPTTVSLFNFAKDQGLTIKKSQRWANRLTDVGVLTDNATRGTFASQVLTFTPSSDTFFTAGSILSFFLIGRPKEIVHKLMLAPFRVEDFNVPGDEQMRGVAGLRKISERSQVFYKRVPYRLSRAYA